ncbi:ABC transporter substrate-binding protein [Bacteriovorax sp. Seq25_V]|uniref:ABC transporter substrate-binding protein n=1 Tax=Bacteriovorax sp. Seq25_V TaxID=1201288 RepID=UPI00038A282D|nr:ABC transporter substrate-binding protein [Bacteriovorax sp. Seq25_V]EQC43235.1 ABC transporter, substrate-binding protein, family 5 [Bacteriovorax sp. Seq25_V]
MKKSFNVINIFLILSVLLTLSSCFKSKSSNSKVLSFPLSGEISTLDPANSYDNVSLSVVYQGYEQLFEYHYLLRPYKITPLLATEMPRIENQGKRYIITIKKNIPYHDDPSFQGQKRFVKAEDFINQIKRLAFIPLRSNGWWLFDGRIKGLNKFRNDVQDDYEKLLDYKVEGLTAPDDHTLIIDLEQPYPQMMNALSMSFTSPIPREAIIYHKNMLDNIIIGTGAYKLDSWERGSKVTMSKFDEYHTSFYPAQGDRLAHSRKLLVDAGKRLPFIEKINFHVIKESQTRWLQFMSGNLDFLRVPKDNYQSLVTASGELTDEFKEKGVTLEIFSTLTFWWISFNMNDSLLGKNINLRKAIAHAINVDKYVQTFTNNIGLKANSIFPPGIPGYDPTKTLPYSYNVEKAKEYLAKAGFPNGKGLPELIYDTRGSSTTQRQRAEFIKVELQKIGINIKVQTNTFPGFLKKAKEGQLQIWLDGWSLDYPDAENVLQLLISKNHPPGPNATTYNNKKFDELFEKLKLLQNGPEKFAIMKEMEAMVIDDLPWALLFYSRDYIVYHNRLKNFRYSDLITNKVKYLSTSDN